MTKQFGQPLFVTKPFSILALAAFAAAAIHAEAGRAGVKDEKSAIAYYRKAATLGSDDAAAALKRLRCPFVMKDKGGKTAGSICFDGKN